MKVVFHPKAELEFLSACHFYKDCEPQVALRFDRAVSSVVDSLRTRADIGWPHLCDTRLERVRGFPYGVIFLNHGDCTLVVAISHTSRRPGYWADHLT